MSGSDGKFPNLLLLVNYLSISRTYWAGGPWWEDYMFTLHPDINGKDRPQWNVLNNCIHNYISLPYLSSVEKKFEKNTDLNKGTIGDISIKKGTPAGRIEVPIYDDFLGEGIGYQVQYISLSHRFTILTLNYRIGLG